MSRYINAESLASKVKKHLNPHTDEFGMISDEFRMVSVEEADRWFLSLIENEPTADVIALPCPIGTRVYRIRRVGDLDIGYDQVGVRSVIFDLCWYYQFGKTVFLTEEEAKNRLKEMTKEEIKEVLRWS